MRSTALEVVVAIDCGSPPTLVGGAAASEGYAITTATNALKTGLLRRTDYRSAARLPAWGVRVA